MLVQKKPQPLIYGEVCKIPLSKDLYAIVDPEWFWILAQRHWKAVKSKHLFYAVTRIKKNGKVKTIRMHRLIAHCPPGQETHHKNLNPLDNRRSNLVNLTPPQHKEAHKFG